MELNVTANPDYLSIWEFEKYDHEGMRLWLQDGNWRLSIYASFLYLIVVFGGQKWMENRKPFHLRQYFILWNVLLAVLSFAVFVRMAPELFVQVLDTGFFSSLCTL
jgi:hypothetical protein